MAATPPVNRDGITKGLGGGMRAVALISILFLTTLSPAHGYSEQHCSRLLESRLEATKAKNYNRALQLSSDYEKECVAIDDLDGLTSAIDGQAHALLMLQNPAKALSTADRCLALNSNGNCYTTRGLALIKLARFDEGLASIQEAKRSLIAEIAVVDIAVRGATTEFDRDRWALKRDVRRQMLQHVEYILANIKRPRDQPAQKASSGSAIAISQDGLVLTNYHVVDKCKTIEVTSENGRSPASVKASDRATDLALLQSRLVFPSVASFRLTAAEQGETIAVVGFPLVGLLSSEGSVSFGHVTALRGINDDLQKLQISAPVQPGNSGGPLLDQSGRLLGVVVQKLDALRVAQVTGDIPQNINFAIKAEVAQMFLRVSNVKTTTLWPSPPLSNTELAKLGKGLTALVTCSR